MHLTIFVTPFLPNSITSWSFVNPYNTHMCVLGVGTCGLSVGARVGGEWGFLEALGSAYLAHFHMLVLSRTLSAIEWSTSGGEGFISM